MTTFLDLSDDCLLQIAHFVHQDSDIPFPSLTPHWQNYASVITSKNNAHFLALRGVCKRMRAVLGMRRLHLSLRTWGRMVELVKQGPSIVLHGIRRLEVEICRPVPRGLVSAWVAFLNFLSRLPRLEELVILDLSLCRHEGSNTPTTTYTETSALPFPNPAPPVLPHLTSLGIRGSAEIKYLLVPYHDNDSATIWRFNFVGLTEDTQEVDFFQLHSFFSHLSCVAPNLSFIDYGITVHIPPPHNVHVLPTRGMDRNKYPSISVRNAKLQQRHQNYHTQCRLPRLVASAQLFIDGLPSVRSGAFWEEDRKLYNDDDENRGHQSGFRRWTWVAEEGDDGVVRPVFNDTPEVVTTSFVWSSEGNAFLRAEQAEDAEWE
ncbi:hypothetical protein IAT38_003809 [Cryptococcus sp. DSM 104549]